MTKPQVDVIASVQRRQRWSGRKFATGGRMRITGSVDAATVSALIKALATSNRRR
jgi:hypothetical protein